MTQLIAGVVAPMGYSWETDPWKKNMKSNVSCQTPFLKAFWNHITADVTTASTDMFNDKNPSYQKIYKLILRPFENFPADWRKNSKPDIPVMTDMLFCELFIVSQSKILFWKPCWYTERLGTVDRRYPAYHSDLRIPPPPFSGTLHPPPPPRDVIGTVFNWLLKIRYRTYFIERDNRNYLQ